MVTSFEEFNGTLAQYIATVEREVLWHTVVKTQFNYSAAARALGLTYRAMRYKTESLGIKTWTGAGNPPRAVSRSRALGPHWPKLRMDALRQYGNRCQCCGAGPEQSVLHVDHVKPRHLYPHLEFDLDNLQVLCAPCHQSKGNNETDWR